MDVSVPVRPPPVPVPLILSRRLHCRAIVAPLESDEEMQLRIRPDLSNIMASGINLAALEDQR